jgi:hypothetical protein
MKNTRRGAQKRNHSQSPTEPGSNSDAAKLPSVNYLFPSATIISPHPVELLSSLTSSS